MKERLFFVSILLGLLIIPMQIYAQSEGADSLNPSDAAVAIPPESSFEGTANAQEGTYESLSEALNAPLWTDECREAITANQTWWNYLLLFAVVVPFVAYVYQRRAHIWDNVENKHYPKAQPIAVAIAIGLAPGIGYFLLSPLPALARVCAEAGPQEGLMVILAKSLFGSSIPTGAAVIILVTVFTVLIAFFLTKKK